MKMDESLWEIQASQRSWNLLSELSLPSYLWFGIRGQTNIEKLAADIQVLLSSGMMYYRFVIVNMNDSDMVMFAKGM